MIALDFITEWRARAPWVEDAQVEQDLILSRALVEIFRRDELAEALAFRGGTSLYKLFLSPAARYSEDLDLVQTTAGPIGETLDGLRQALDPWLGEPRRSFGEGRVSLIYRVQSEGQPPLPIRLKVEINSREHFSVFGFAHVPFEVESRWFAGRARIQTYSLEELLGTKLRALYQRRKARDLFDLWVAQRSVAVSAERVVEALQRYLEHQGLGISRAEFEANVALKVADWRFLSDVEPLLARGTSWDPPDAVRYIRDELLARLPGEPWKGDANT